MRGVKTMVAAASVLVLSCGAASAQWANLAPNHINNTNAGGVGVGVSSAAFMFGKLSVLGDGDGSVGVWARSLADNGAALYGESLAAGGTGVLGYSGNVGGGQQIAVWGISAGSNGVGVVGQAQGAGSSIGVYGVTASGAGYAGYFAGRGFFTGPVGVGVLNPTAALEVNGVFTAAGIRTAVDSATPPSSVNVFGGVAGNGASTAAVAGATIAGGGAVASIIPEIGANTNTVHDHATTIGGGFNNRAGENDGSPAAQRGATVAGGVGNWARGQFSFVGGGNNNTAGGLYSAIIGGFNNSTILGNDYAVIMGGNGNSAGSFALVGGGQANTASGQFSVIPGGASNTATGAFSCAAGNNARALHQNAFVWNGSGAGTNLDSSANGQFVVNALGGMYLGRNLGGAAIVTAGNFIQTQTGAVLTNGGAWTNASDVSLKENFTPLSPREVLERLAGLPVTRWNYKAEGGSVTHIGPMAQDFHKAFGVGTSDKTISTVDTAGVTIAAIQGLREIVREREAEIDQLKADRAALEARLQRLEVLLEQR
jgi:hypothetical protein